MNQPELEQDTTLRSGIVFVSAPNLPQAWEEAIVSLYNNGIRIKTQYDKPEDPPSIDATAMIEILNPFAEPRIHRCFPDSITGLEAYRQEVVDGIHDHWVCPEEGKWEYTYHERLRNYTVPGLDKPIDQIQYVIDALKECAYTRRAQAVTWKAWEDNGIHDPSCLQRMWFRVIDGKLQLNVHMRSNDAFKASFMNIFGFTDLQRIVAEAIDVPVGKYIHIADSFHLYGSYTADIDGFFRTLQARTFEERTYRTDDPLMIELFDEAKVQIAESIRVEKETGRKGI